MSKKVLVLTFIAFGGLLFGHINPGVAAWMVCPLLTIVSGRLLQRISSRGCRAVIGLLRSSGDCWVPLEHIPFAASRVPHLSVPVAPS